ncbi:MAG: class I SAM-dependent methyltransferase [Xenococcaceae cyanobacterium MO_188.B19]|nr:class I SAM-dependent methyltransferase [Xenococcaceae cyanobacterium MO_188.B19]
MVKSYLAINICPLCNSKRYQPIIRISNSSEKTDSQVTIQKCLRCSNAWTFPSPDYVDYKNEDFHQQSISVSSQLDIKTISDLPEEWQKSLKMQVSLIKRYLQPRAKILEIGCGEGILLSELAYLGFIVEGIEPSFNASLRAKNKGLKITNSLFPDYFPEQKFDLVILSHVLEHIQNPSRFLRTVSQLIPNGYLLLIQTNYQGLIPRLRTKDWYAWVPNEHYWHFTPFGLTFLVNKLNFRLIKCEYSSLVHTGKKNKLLQIIAKTIPQYLDQFHILFKLNN